MTRNGYGSGDWTRWPAAERRRREKFYEDQRRAQEDMRRLAQLSPELVVKLMRRPEQPGLP